MAASIDYARLKVMHASSEHRDRYQEHSLHYCKLIRINIMNENSISTVNERKLNNSAVKLNIRISAGNAPKV